MAITNAQQYKQLLAQGGRIGFQGGGKDSSTISSGDFKARDYSPAEKKDQQRTADINQRISESERGKQQTANTQAAINRAQGINVQKEKKSILDRINTYNKNYKQKQKDRYTLSKINELNAKLRGLGLNFYGDTEETYADFIGQYAPSITEFGPKKTGGTGKYSQEFIDDVLSGKRKAPESFSEIDISKVPGGMLTKGLAVGANFLGEKMAGPTTEEELMDLAYGDKNSYARARDIDINNVTSKQMMEEFEPNRYAREFGPSEGGDGPQDPCKGPNPPAYCFVGIRSATPEVEEEDPFTPNFRLMADGGRAALAEGGMPYEGGIMDLESARQMYGLGKLVKKITRGVKKIVKSPIGKAALLAGGAGLFGFGPAKGLAGTKFGLGFKDFMAFGNVDKALDIGSKSFKLGSLISNPLVAMGVPTLASYFLTPEEEEEQLLAKGADIDDPKFIMANASKYTNPRLMAEGGSTEEPVAKKTMPLLDMDGQEMDLRAEGGFVPIGRMEKADDVPARLSKNEFVFTADAVRNAGEGDVDKGAEVMYNMMKNLESGGDVSEESQGLEGARDMFKTSQRLEEVL